MSPTNLQPTPPPKTFEVYDGERPEANDKIAVVAQAMSHEIRDNQHKGDWLTEADKYRKGLKVAGVEPTIREPGTRPLTDEELLADLLYHAVKLGHAAKKGDNEAVLEYVADVANCAWFVADKHDALDLALLHEGPIEYDPDHSLGEAFQKANWKDRCKALAFDIFKPLPTPIPPEGPLA